MNIFVYGTLLDDDLRQAVMDATLRSARPARLRCHWRLRVAGTPYPTLRPDPRYFVDGLVLMHLGSRVGQRLSKYEGPAYRLRQCLVKTHKGTVSAYTYLTDLGRATAEPWSFEEWRNRNRARDMHLLR